MDQPTATFLGALTSAFFAIGSVIIIHYLAVRREAAARIDAEMRADRVKRLEILLTNNERQISEFYAPLYALIRRILVTLDISKRLEEKP